VVIESGDSEKSTR